MGGDGDVTAPVGATKARPDRLCTPARDEVLPLLLAGCAVANCSASRRSCRRLLRRLVGAGQRHEAMVGVVVVDMQTSTPCLASW